jgi:hypothetical protein
MCTPKAVVPVPVPVPERDIEPVVEAIVEPTISIALPAKGPAEIEIEPKVDSTVIEVNFTFPDPERVRLSLAEKFPVGVIESPPEIVKVPLVAVSDAAPE